MSSVPKQRLEQVSQHLRSPNEVASFEGIPKIREVARDSVGPRVEGKVIIVTGANSPTGIGRASAHQFARNGACAVFICDYSDTYLATHERELKSLYPSVDIHPRKFDASDETAVKTVVDEAIEKYGRLDVFFANAGVVGQAEIFTRVTGENFMNTLKTNALRHVLAGTNIRCNAICPGIIETGMTATIYEAARARGSEGKIGQLNPTRRGAQPDEVARMALFLASDEASYVNGQAIAVCGGLSSGHPVVPGRLG
ncbi:MAG: hypothetical protein M1813_004924 [Trichoglossum hirsutum]|nr:MAG: hypothetical protein M1813_004924 [Trichoglossum hirsutum]